MPATEMHVLETDGGRTDPRPARTRVLAIATAALFLISSVFPIAAGIAKDTAAFARSWGVLDVALAFVLAVAAMAVSTVGQRHVDADIERRTYRAYRALAHGILALLVVFFLVGDRISWINCLTGFAWRTWLLLYTLPAWLALWRRR